MVAVVLGPLVGCISIISWIGVAGYAFDTPEGSAPRPAFAALRVYLFCRLRCPSTLDHLFGLIVHTGGAAVPWPPKQAGLSPQVVTRKRWPKLVDRHGMCSVWR